MTTSDIPYIGVYAAPDDIHYAYEDGQIAGATLGGRTVTPAQLAALLNLLDAARALHREEDAYYNAPRWGEEEALWHARHDARTQLGEALAALAELGL